MAHYSILKKKGILTCTATQTNPEDMWQNKASHKGHILHDSTFMRYLEHSNSETESRMMVVRDCRVGSGT